MFSRPLNSRFERQSVFGMFVESTAFQKLWSFNLKKRNFLHRPSGILTLPYCYQFYGLFFKDFDIGSIFLTVRDRILACMLTMHAPDDKTFPMIPYILNVTFDTLLKKKPLTLPHWAPPDSVSFLVTVFHGQWVLSCFNTIIRQFPTTPFRIK